ncbi:MAG TPA: type II toxin-antitoxin system HipA family toxin [Micromonosporaceae bacterium]|nr:type II toxin-antitoxin system HipA family toxin [Micromonosporaceae bacterium]HCU52228.1 type II toxin-antitoxin system HipA family toxin [Micromonosporaceae bacterium]
MTQPDNSDLEQLRAVDEAEVFKAGQRAATLTRTRKGIEFRYFKDWITDGGQPIATTLPVRPEPVVHSGGALPAYFTGLLPEGRRLGALRRAVKTSADDELSLLLAVGADAIGDVQVVPSGVKPAEVPARVVLERIGDIRFADLLAELGIRAQRTALPGVQDKTSAAMINLPIARAGERYILKLNPAEYPHLVENEKFFLDAARKSGLIVPPSEIVTDGDGKPGLLIRRFDRITVDGALHPLAVEDGCQVLDRPPADKYLVGAGRTFAALAAVCDARTVAGRDLIRQLAFAYITGNGDAHAKNFSVLQHLSGEWRVSPAYDMPSSYPYGDKTMALSIGERSGGDFGAADFVRLGEQLDVPDRAVRRLLSELTERADIWLSELQALPFDSGKTSKLRRVAENRLRRLAP